MSAPTTAFIAKFVTDGQDDIGLSIYLPSSVSGSAQSGYSLDIYTAPTSDYTQRTLNSYSLGTVLPDTAYIIGNSSNTTDSTLSGESSVSGLFTTGASTLPVLINLLQNGVVIDSLVPVTGSSGAPAGLTLVRNNLFTASAGSYAAGDYTTVNTSNTADLAAYTYRAPDNLPTGSVTITGNAVQDQVLTASNTLADADGLGVISYQWQRDDGNGGWTSIAGATGSSYTLTAADIGHAVEAVASYTDGAGYADSVTSAATSSVTHVNHAPTGSVTIGGTAAQDQVLTASNTLADSDGLGAISYQWQRDDGNGGWNAIAGATGSSYTLTAADIGHTVETTASYTDTYGTAEAVTSTATATVTHVNHSPTGTVTIAGTAVQDQVLTASNTLADSDGLGAISYQWQRDDGNGGWTSIAGATGSSYTLTAADIGHTVETTASYTDTYGTAEAVTSTATATVTHVNHSPTGSVTIAGTAVQDQVLTASNTLADSDGLGAISYQWQRDDGNGGWTSIAGATGSSYTLTAADIGHTLETTASYTDTYGTAEAVTSTATAAVTHVNHSPTGSVSIAGTAAQDQVLTASNTLADSDGLGAISYQWQRDDGNGGWTSIAGATGSSYTLTAADIGHTLETTASYTDTYGTAEAVTSTATAAVTHVNHSPTGSVSIAGTAAQDQVLTASNTLADSDGLGAISYQWQRSDGNGGWNAIAGATGSSYTLTAADIGHTVETTASYTDTYGTAEAVTSTATAAVTHVNHSPTGSVSIAGAAVDGQVLTASNTLADTDGLGAISYQWQRNDGAGGWISISGATSGTYTSTLDDINHTVRVTAAYTDGFGTVETVASAATSTIPDPLFDATYYLAQNPDVAASGADPYAQYMTTGWKEGRNPDAYFDTKFYLAMNPDVAAAGVNPLTHFEQHGWMEGRQPSLAFSDGGYLAANPSVAAQNVDPLVQFLTVGQGQGLSAITNGPTTSGSSVADPMVNASYAIHQVATIVPTNLDVSAWYHETGWKVGVNPDQFFDTNYYLAQNPDVKAAGVDPLSHFETYGWREGRDPSLMFSDSKYLAANPDVAAAGVDPLLHYIDNGQYEGRATFLAGGSAAADPLVNASFYDKQLGATLIPTGVAAQQQAAASYDTSGWQKGLNPDAWFDTNYYLAQNPDVAAAHIDPLVHYETYGWHEGRNPSAQFSTNQYLAANPDVAAAGVDPLLHYVNNGQFEGRAIYHV